MARGLGLGLRWLGLTVWGSAEARFGGDGGHLWASAEERSEAGGPRFGDSSAFVTVRRDDLGRCCYLKPFVCLGDVPEEPGAALLMRIR